MFTILKECPRCHKIECDYVSTEYTEKFEIQRVRCRNCGLVFEHGLVRST
jgi:transcription elongation factor Elf1